MVDDQLFEIRDGSFSLAGERPGEPMSAVRAAACWLYSDVQADGREVVELVDRLSRLTQHIVSDDDEPYERSGNAWYAVIDAAGVTLENHYIDYPPLTLSHADMLEVLGQFWECFRLAGKRSSLRRGVDRSTRTRGRAPEIPFPLEPPRIHKR
ncbi:hypothetical protein LTV02_13200 [Nocardia yamanashiensis]|uniref:hypothetical protein n=1 Tax=Nocardia yamanashiensis TaxID=209247 RepID=UPI001E2E2326|nr:hypothetical protein [Nocardia yamanashiensis]UGT44286.1 hypothetical protein LTV02_13200 [Nocardia yamanashiensis]